MSKPILTSGAQFKEFYNDDVYWASWSIGEVLLAVDGVESYLEDGIGSITDDAHIEVKGGYLNWEGSGENDVIGFDVFFKKWQSKNTNSRLVVEVSKSKEAELRKLLSTFDCKVS